MALKPDRDYQSIDDVSHFWASSPVSATSEKGGVASLVTAGSGVSLDNAANVVDYKATPSGAIPKGVMIADVKTYTGSRYFRNLHNGEVLPGEKVCLIRKGWIVTNAISGTPTAGAAAYLAENGNISPTQMTEAPAIGKFETTKDENGYAKVYVDL
jgi:hypothetical protein